MWESQAENYVAVDVVLECVGHTWVRAHVEEELPLHSHYPYHHSSRLPGTQLRDFDLPLPYSQLNNSVHEEKADQLNGEAYMTTNFVSARSLVTIPSEA